MDNSRWEKIQQLFEAALEKNPRQQESFLRDSCGGDLELFEEVRSLLEADTNTHSLLQSPAMDQVDLGELFTRDGELIGPYRIIRQIGKGGMGAVYLAERADGQFEQQVALKLIKPGMDTEEILKRFQGERQILARLQHPNIARLLDGGITDRGLPYFTMEYVDGLPIDQYCDQQQFDISQRLKLFETICTAVQYAHQNLVIHRDIKPSNIIITPEGDVKLLDFGIAAMLSGDQEGFAFTMMTEQSRRVMTPEYASPEQTRGLGVTTASDVYSLGIVLYQLLTGRRPYRVTSRLPEEVERIVLETLPKKPSTAITKSVETETDTVTPETISQFRKTTTDKLKRQLSGDLDNICLMALQKEPQSRYKSVDQLRLDIQRHLEGLPVLARPQTFLYYTEKFLRRHRTVLSIALLVLSILIGLTIFYTSRLEKQRDLAQLEADKAAQVSEFLTSIFEVSDPYKAKGETITAHELLDRGAARIEQELADQPEVRAALMDVMGNVYYKLGLFTEADSLLKQSLRIREDLFQNNRIEVATSLSHLGQLKRDQGEYPIADSLFKEALEIQRKILGNQHRDIASTLSDLGWLSHDLGKFDQAEKYYRESIQILRDLSLTNDPAYPTILDNLAQLLHEVGQYEQADSLFQESLELQLQLHGEYHPEVSTTLYNYAQLMQTKGEYEKAESMYRRTLKIDKKVLGNTHPDVAYTLSSLGRVLIILGKYQEAEPLLHEALSIRRKALGSSHPDVAFSLDHLGGLMEAEGNYTEAETYYEESLDILKRFYGQEHPEVVQVLHHLGIMYQKMGNLKQAEKILNGVLQTRIKLYGEKHRLVANVQGTLAKVYQDLGKFERSDSLYKEAFNIYISVTGREHPSVASILQDRGDLCEQRNNFNKADSFFGEALKIRKNVLPENHPAIGKSYLRIGDLFIKEKKYKDAESYLRRGLTILKKDDEPGNSSFALAKISLAKCLIGLQRYEEADSLLQSSYAALQKLPTHQEEVRLVKGLLALTAKKL